LLLAVVVVEAVAVANAPVLRQVDLVVMVEYYMDMLKHQQYLDHLLLLLVVVEVQVPQAARRMPVQAVQAVQVHLAQFFLLLVVVVERPCQVFQVAIRRRIPLKTAHRVDHFQYHQVFQVIYN
jgi:hypothetical protein